MTQGQLYLCEAYVLVLGGKYLEWNLFTFFKCFLFLISVSLDQTIDNVVAWFRISYIDIGPKTSSCVFMRNGSKLAQTNKVSFLFLTFQKFFILDISIEQIRYWFGDWNSDLDTKY